MSSKSHYSTASADWANATYLEADLMHLDASPSTRQARVPEQFRFVSRASLFQIKLPNYFLELNEDQRLSMNLGNVHNEDDQSTKPAVCVISSTTTDNRPLDNPV